METGKESSQHEIRGSAVLDMPTGTGSVDGGTFRGLKEDEKYRLLFDRMLNGFALSEIVPDANGTPVDIRFLEVNPALEGIIGCKGREIVGRTAREIFSDVEGQWLDKFAMVALTGEPVTFNEHVRSMDRILEIRAFSPLPGRFAVIFDDITRRVRIEETLRESELREKARAAELAALMEAVPAMVLIAHDPDCMRVTGNRAACELLKVPSGGNLSKTAPDGERPVHYRIYKNGVETPACDLPLQRAARGEEIRDYEQDFIFADGERHTLLGNATPLKDGDGCVYGAVATFVDITERKDMENELLRNQKLESLGVLAGGIAHDFNNILTTILGNVSLARMQLHDGDKIAKRLAEVENAAARAKDLSQQLLTFAKGGEPVKSSVEMGTLLKEATEFAVLGSPVRCEFSLDGGLLPVEADEGQLRQVVHNLVINSVQSMPEGGVVKIAARNVNHSGNNGRCIEFSIADTGTGIPEQYLQRIFDPYFTTKQQGSGLGLAVCYSVIKKHGGSISVDSTLGKGSAFHVTLPAIEQGPAYSIKPDSGVDGAPLRVLVMDDEEQVREIVQDMLEELGFESECASNGNEAVDLYRKRKEDGKPFYAVILDLTIPGGVGGKDAIKSLLELDPEVNAVVSSGYSTDPILASYRDFGFRAVLGKPYRLQDMERLFQGLLRQGV